MHSRRVMQVAKALNVPLELKDIFADEATLAELLEKGGKKQTPFLVDDAKNVSMYESEDIIDYIRAHYASASAVATAKPRMHISDAVCESCEG